MVAVLDRELVTTNVAAWLAMHTGRSIGVGEAPTAAPQPYGILYPILGGRFRGPAFSAPDIDAEAVYQFTSIGTGRQQAEWMADRARHVFLDRNANGSFVTASPVIAGWVVYDRSPDSGPPGVVPDGSGLWRADERFVLSLTPA